MNKTTKTIIVILISVLIIVGIVVIVQKNKKDDTSKNDIMLYDLESEDGSSSNLEDDELLFVPISEELIRIAKETEPSGTYFYAKYVLLGRETENDNYSVYIWAQYGRANQDSIEESATSVPIKMTFSLGDSSIVNTDVPPDGTDYKKYFEKVSKKISEVENKNKEELFADKDVFFSE